MLLRGDGVATPSITGTSLHDSRLGVTSVDSGRLSLHDVTIFRVQQGLWATAEAVRLSHVHVQACEEDGIVLAGCTSARLEHCAVSHCRAALVLIAQDWDVARLQHCSTHHCQSALVVSRSNTGHSPAAWLHSPRHLVAQAICHARGAQSPAPQLTDYGPHLLSTPPPPTAAAPAVPHTGLAPPRTRALAEWLHALETQPMGVDAWRCDFAAQGEVVNVSGYRNGVRLRECAVRGGSQGLLAAHSGTLLALGTQVLDCQVGVVAVSSGLALLDACLVSDTNTGLVVSSSAQGAGRRAPAAQRRPRLTSARAGCLPCRSHCV